MKNYLMVLELQNHGFIIGTTERLSEAKKTLNELLRLYRLYEPDAKKFFTHLSGYRSYHINGNNLLIEKYKYGTNNGPLTSSIIVINPETFSVDLFIRERENSSHIFGGQSIDALYEIFKDDFISILAN